MKLFSWAFLTLLVILIVTLSIGNRDSVPFSLFPLPYEMEIPLYVLILGGGFIGVLLGSIRTWLSAGKTRGENRSSKQEILRLKGEIARLEKEHATQTAEINKDAKHLLELTKN